MSSLRFNVADLIGRPGERRKESGEVDLDLTVGESAVSGRAVADVILEGIDDGVLARFTVSAPAHLVCTRCLTGWDDTVRVEAVQLFEPEPDEDGYALGPDDTIDLVEPVRDEVALAIPVRPLCRPDCAGLCPTCGTDLNRDPCEGHEEPTRSPFAALQGFFDPPDD